MKRHLQKLDILGLVLLVAGLLYYMITDIWSGTNLTLVFVGIILVLIGAFANYRKIMASIGKRSSKYAANYVISIILVVVLVSGINYLGHRHPKRFDLTASGMFTLSPQTTQILGKLDKPLEIKAFYPDGDYPPLRELLTEYRSISSEVRFEFIDPDWAPEVAAVYEVTVYGSYSNPLTGSQLKFGTVVLSYAGRRHKIEKRSGEVQEEDLTNALIKVQRVEQKKVYFVRGHGEKDPDDSDRLGLSAAKKRLEDQGFGVDKVNLAMDGTVPDDARVLVIAGPTVEPLPQEYTLLQAFQENGGGLLILLDPHPSASLSVFLKDWGISPENNVVLDISGFGRLLNAGPSVSLVVQYENHIITEDFEEMTFFPLVRSISIFEAANDGVLVEPLFLSNPGSWGETDLESEKATLDEGTDKEGPLNLAVAVTRERAAASEEDPPITSRMVVVGDSDFASNSSFSVAGDSNLFLNMVSWLGQEEDLISIRPKPQDDRRVILSQSQKSLVRVTVLILLPCAFLIAGIVVWARRRR